MDLWTYGPMDLWTYGPIVLFHISCGTMDLHMDLPFSSSSSSSSSHYYRISWAGGAT